MAEPAREELSALAAIFCGPNEWEVLSRSGDYPAREGPGALPSPPPRWASCPGVRTWGRGGLNDGVKPTGTGVVSQQAG